MNTEWIESSAEKIRLPDLYGRSALVTGASSGIGKAAVDLLLENGVKVFGISRESMRRDEPDFIHFDCDLSDPNGIETVFRSIAGWTEHLDYLVNVAGIDPKHAVDEATVAQWDLVLDLNLRAYYFVIKAAMPFLRRGTGRSIVNVSSINYRLGVPGRSAYSASKAGILGLTTGLSRELGAENIRINTVSPGWTFTERQIKEYFEGDESPKNLAYLASRQALKLKLTAGDVANHILFYLSQCSRASTGHNCVVDGGWILE